MFETNFFWKKFSNNFLIFSPGRMGMDARMQCLWKAWYGFPEGSFERNKCFVGKTYLLTRWSKVKKHWTSAKVLPTSDENSGHSDSWTSPHLAYQHCRVEKNANQIDFHSVLDLKAAWKQECHPSAVLKTLHLPICKTGPINVKTNHFFPIGMVALF